MRQEPLTAKGLFTENCTVVGKPIALAVAYRRNRYSGLDGLKSSSERPLVTIFEYL
jgi:hypothetical protein